MFKKTLYYQNSGGIHSLLTCLLVCMWKMLFQVKFFLSMKPNIQGPKKQLLVFLSMNM